MAEKKVINLDVETNVGSLRSQLRQAQADVAAMAEKFGATSTEAANAAKKAAELRDKIGDAKALTDAFNPDAKFNALTGAIGGALNGFQAFEGALGIIGVESEDLQKTLLKVQAAMALSQGIQGAMEAKDAFVALGSVVKNSFAAMTAAGRAFALTGIGLVVTAIGGLVYAYQTMNDEAEQAAQAQKILDNNIKKTNESIQNQKENIDAVNNIRDLETRRIIAEAKKRGASEEELTRITIKAKKDRIDSLSDEVEQAKKLYLQKSKYGTTEEYEASRKAFLDIQKTYDELQVSLEEDLAEQAVKKREKANDALLQKEKDFNEYLSKIKNEKVLTDDEIEAIFTQQLIDEENKRAEAQKARLAEQKADEESYLKWRWDAYWQTTKYEEEEAEKRKQLEKDVLNAKVQIVQDSLALISDITSLFGRRNEKEARRAFQIDKAAKLASATMAGVEGTIEAYKTAQKSPITAVLPAYPIIQAGLAAAFAATNIAKIASAQFNAGGGGAGGNLSPNAPSGASSGVNAPNLSFSMQGGGSSTAQLLNSVLGQPLKAYVVSSDITSAQMLDAKAIKTSVL